MATLLDITSDADNISSMRPWSQNSFDVLLSGNTIPTPSFMSPTIASRVASLGHMPKRNSSPTSMSSQKSNSSNWMSAAARRVGVNRTKTGAPHSTGYDKLFSQSSRSLPSYKLSTRSNLKLRDSQVSTPAEPRERSYVDKPLPIPPIAHIMNGDSAQQERSLIDAAEKPLTRSSPGDLETVEDWPVLHPEKLIIPDTTLELTQPAIQASSAGLTNPELNPGKERYPAIVNADSLARQGAKRKNVFSHSMPPKAASLTGTLVAGPDHALLVASGNNAETLGDLLPEQGGGMTASVIAKQELSSKTLPNLPRSIASRSSHNFKVPKVPRQTKTSRLRARLSAGKPFDKDTELSHSASPGDAVRMKGKSSDISTAIPRPIEPKAVLGGPWGPAHMVAGSRRPARTSRRQSQIFAGDSRSNKMLKTPHPHDLAPQVSTTSVCRKPLVNIQSQDDTPVLHDSTVVKHPTENVEYHELDSVSTVIAQAETSSAERDNDVAAHEFNIFEEPSASVPHLLVKNTDVGATTTTICSGSADATSKAADELAKPGFTMKRLSKAAPDHGATLWVSHSARRLIMGDDESDKENLPSAANKQKESRHALMAKDSRKPQEETVGRQRGFTGMTRPATSLGLPGLSPSKIGNTAMEARKKRAQSIGIDYALGTTHLEPFRRTTGASSKSTTTSIGDDPFFDACSHVEDNKAGVSRANSLQLQPKVLYEDAIKGEPTWIAPGVERNTSSKLGNAKSITAEPMAEAATLIMDKSIPEETSSEIGQANENVIMQEATLTTPQRDEHGTAASPSGSFPPRSSSRRTVPDFTVNGSIRQSNVSSLSSIKHLTQETISRQISIDESVNPVLSSQTNVEDVFAKRGSVTQASTRTQSSLSKAVFSNVRDFFQKRNPDKSRLNPGTNKQATRKPKVVIIKNAGSAFPPVNGSYRFDRPTIASASKNKVVPKHDPTQSEIMVPTMAVSGPPEISELSNTTALAMEILESARVEPSSPKKEQLLKLGKVMVDALTQTRDAAKSMEEAKLAARKAEMSYLRCMQSVDEIAKSVQAWKLDRDPGDLNTWRD
ncbi:hypothetical protein MMC13_008296 [Lambiella insularis]|nr:hypothetical protein [Lambiella insularis]